jgi:hypothetical protein
LSKITIPTIALASLDTFAYAESFNVSNENQNRATL